MARIMTNKEHIEGWVYQSTLEMRTVQKQNSENYGKPFITGELQIAVDDEGLNIIPVHYTYVGELTSVGKRNNSYVALSTIINSPERTWMTGGKDNALKVKINTALTLNDFYSRDGERVSAKRNEGGFIAIVNDLAPVPSRNTFKEDVIFTKCRRVEANPESGAEKDYLALSGCIFNFRNEIFDNVEFVVRDDEIMNYFENQNISQNNPFFTQVLGYINCSSVTISQTTETMFHKAAVTTTERTVKEWIINDVAPTPYLFDDESTITADEVRKLLQNREFRWAEIKKRNEEYQASRNASPIYSTPTANDTAIKSNNNIFSF